MFCNKCGTQMNSNMIFCPECGNRVEPSQTVTTAIPQKAEQPKKSKVKMILISSIIFVLLGTVATVLLFNTGIINPAEYQIKLGYKLITEGKYEEAVLAFNKAIDIKPKSVEARIGSSQAYIKLEKYDVAEKVLNEALDINAKYENTYKILIELYVKLGKTDILNALLERGKQNGIDIDKLLASINYQITIYEAYEDNSFYPATRVIEKTNTSAKTLADQMKSIISDKYGLPTNSVTYVNGKLTIDYKNSALPNKLDGGTSSAGQYGKLIYDTVFSVQCINEYEEKLEGESNAQTNHYSFTIHKRNSAATKEPLNKQVLLLMGKTKREIESIIGKEQINARAYWNGGTFLQYQNCSIVYDSRTYNDNEIPPDNAIATSMMIKNTVLFPQATTDLTLQDIKNIFNTNATCSYSESEADWSVSVDYNNCYLLIASDSAGNVSLTDATFAFGR